MLESEYSFDYQDVGASGNGLILNDWVNRDINNSPFGWYQLTSIDGLWDTDMRTESHDVPGRAGARSGDFFYSGKTLVLSGVIRAADMPRLRQMQRALVDAFEDMNPHKLFFKVMDGGGHELDVDDNRVFTAPTTTSLYLTCRKNQKIDMPEVQTNLQYTRPFTIQLFADDPAIYVEGSGDTFFLF